MSWLRKLLNGEHDAAAEPAPARLAAADLVPPALPHLESRDPVPLDDRPYASTVCPYCDAQQKPVPRETSKCETCGEAIVVKGGEDGKRYLLREDEMEAFEQRQEQTRSDRYERDEAVLTDAGFLIGERSVDVVEESDSQAVLEKLAGGRSRFGAAKEVVVLLSREPDHPHDKNAVRVSVEGETVGYIEKWDAKDIQPLMLKLEKAGHPAWVRGTVVGGWSDDGGSESFRIRLDALPK
ncbi:MAG: HIRAN domain-containing protein [Chloroflexota bacterium]